MRKFLSVAMACVLVVALSAGAQAATSQVSATLEPATPLIERTQLGQALNFDINIRNDGKKALELHKVRALVRDSAGAISKIIELNDNGIAPGIEIVPNRSIAAGGAMTLFNPFHTIPAAVAIGSIDYELTFQDEAGAEQVARVSARPKAFVQHTTLSLPLKGRLLVWDGHDFYAHHRRLNFNHPVLKQLGVTTNSGRYSYDFVMVGADGSMTQGSADKFEHFLIFRQPVLAPGDGKVVRVVDGVPDGKEVELDEIAKDFAALFGNFLVIDHGNGEFSQLGHLEQGTIRVRLGDKVRRGQQLAEVGTSGSSLFPHLHYQLVSGASPLDEGLPSYFSDADLILGNVKAPLRGKAIDSGDIIEGR